MVWFILLCSYMSTTQRRLDTIEAHVRNLDSRSRSLTVMQSEDEVIAF